MKFAELAEAWRVEPTGDPDVIEPIINAAKAEIFELKCALVASPHAAELLKQMPTAIRLHTAEIDELRTALNQALDIASSEYCDHTGPGADWECDCRTKRISILRHLAAKGRP